MICIRRTIVSLLAATLIGCASEAQTTKFYSLDVGHQLHTATQRIKVAPKENTINVQVLPVEVASYLDNGGLVIQIGEHELVTANYHRWAQPLKESFTRLLIRELNFVSDNHKVHYEQSNHAYSADKPIELLIELEQFHATDQATVVARGRYILLNDSGQKIDETHFEVIEKLSRDGYLHSVEQLKKAVTNLSRLISNDIARLLIN